MQDLALEEPRAAAPAKAEPKPEPLRFAGKSFEVPAARAKLADTPPVRGFGAMKPAQAPRFGKTQLGLEDQAAKVLQETLKTPAPKPSEPGARADEPVVGRRPSPVESRAFHEAATTEVPKLELPPVPPAEEPAPPRTFGWRDELPTHEAIAALPIVNVAGAGTEAPVTAAAAPSPAPAPVAPSEPPIELSVSDQLPVEPAPEAPRDAEPDARRFAEPERLPPQPEPEPEFEPAATARVAVPEKPAFSDGALDAPSKFATAEPEAPTKKKSSLLLVVALIAIVVGAGVFAYTRFFRTTGAPNKKTPAVLPTAAPTAAPTGEATTAATTTATAEAFPTASGDPAAPTASASASPEGSAAPDDLPALPGDPKELPATLGYLLIKAPEGKVFLNGQNAGDVNTWLKISCNGTKFLRLGKATGGWIDEGKSIALKCRESTVIPTP